MNKVTVIALGKLKENYLQEAIKEYTKRLSRFCSLSIVELAPTPLPDDPAQSAIKKALEAEELNISKHIPKDAFVCSLCIEGKQLSSEDLAQKIKEVVNCGKHLCFIIGSSHGLSDGIKGLSDIKLSFSKMTFPHQLFRVLLLEQIYRGFMINEGSKYHK